VCGVCCVFSCQSEQHPIKIRDDQYEIVRLGAGQVEWKMGRQAVYRRGAQGRRRRSNTDVRRNIRHSRFLEGREGSDDTMLPLDASEAHGQTVIRGACGEFEGPGEGTAREWKGMNNRDENGDGAAGTKVVDVGMGMTDRLGITQAGMRVCQSCGRPAGDLWQMQLQSLQVLAGVWCGLPGCLPVLGPCREADNAYIWDLCQDGV
jgi:hypothetical protein